MAGAPTKYKEGYNEQVYKLCLLGATDKDIADFFEVTETTVNNWKIEFPEFFESIKRGKQIADSNVADRLYQRALGFEHDSEEIKIVEGSIERVKVRKVYAPDPTSAIFWLKNRQPEKWRDRSETKLSGDKENPLIPNQEIDYSKLSESLLLELEAAQIKNNE